MALAETKYVVLSDGGFTKTQRESRLETLRSWFVRCPKCAAARLVVGARESELYTCKDCGHRFAIRISDGVHDLSDDEPDSK